MRGNFGEGSYIIATASHQRRAQLKRTAARALRANATIPERKLWHCLRDKRLLGMRFRRQQPIGPYVVDFYCSAAKLIVELDEASTAMRSRHNEIACERAGWRVAAIMCSASGRRIWRIRSM